MTDGKKPKRGHGEGSVVRYDEKKKLHHAKIWIDGRRVSYYGKTPAEVRAKMAKAKAELARGVRPGAGRESVSAFLARWLADVVLPNKEPRTHEDYESIARLHLIPAIGAIRLDRLAMDDVQRFLNAKRAGGASATYVRHMRTVLRIALGHAEREGLVPRNVAVLATPPKAVRYEVRPWDVVQARAFLDAVRDDRLAALFYVPLAVGLRRGEALGLHWADVDLAKGLLAVRTQLQRVNGELVLKATKTPASRATIPLPPPVVAQLVAHRARQEAERAAAGAHWEEHGLVFCRADGTPLDGRSALRLLTRAIKAAGLPHQRFQDLRHCCASLLAAQGVHPSDAQAILRHTNSSLTLEVYTHAYAENVRDAVGRVAGILEADGAKDGGKGGDESGDQGGASGIGKG